MLDNDSALQPEEVVVLFMMYCDDYFTVKEYFRELLLNGVCFLDSDTQMTMPLFEQLSCDDTDRLFGEYVSNFLSQSLMRLQQKK